MLEPAMMNANSPHVLRSAAWATSLALLVCAAQGCGSPPAFGALRATSCGVPAGVANMFEQSSSLDVQYGGGKPVREFLVEIHRPGKATKSRLLGLSVTDDGVGFDQRITAVLQPMEGGRAFFMVHAEGSYGSSVASQMSGLLEDVDPGSPPYALPVRTVTSKRSRAGGGIAMKRLSPWLLSVTPPRYPGAECSPMDLSVMTNSRSCSNSGSPSDEVQAELAACFTFDADVWTDGLQQFVTNRTR